MLNTEFINQLHFNLSKCFQTFNDLTLRTTRTFSFFFPHFSSIPDVFLSKVICVCNFLFMYSGSQKNL